jgi:hypothetical protein
LQKEEAMDWSVLMAVILVAAYAGYLIGLFVRGTFIEHGGGGGGETPPEPLPRTPSGTLTDFELWELEVVGRAAARA